MGQKKAIVCDTNVLASALGWRGPERRLYDACRRGQVGMITSPRLLDELERTLHYPKFDFSEDEIAAFEVDVLGYAGLVEPDAEIFLPPIIIGTGQMGQLSVGGRVKC